MVFATGQYSLVQSVDPLYSLSLSPPLFAVQQIVAAVVIAHLAAESCRQQSDESIRLRGLANLSGNRFGCMQISGESHVSHHDHKSAAGRGERLEIDGTTFLWF